MKKLPLLLLFLFMIAFTSCRDYGNTILPKDSSAETMPTEESISVTTSTASVTEDTADTWKQDYNAIRSSPMILPEEVEIINASADEWFQIFMKFGFTASDIIFGKAYGEEADLSVYQYFPALFDVATDEVKRIIEPSEIADSHWVGTNTKVVLNNKYLYDCRCYNDDNDKFEVSLRRTDIENGVVEIIDTVIQNTPFVNLCKLDESSFLSYSSVTLDDGSVLSEVYKYNKDGEKSLLISEKYIGNLYGNDDGVLIEYLVMKNDKICGIGRRHVDGKTKFYIYTYDIDGRFIEMSEIKNLVDIIGDTSIYDVDICGNYMVFRAYDSMTAYVFEITDNDARLIAKGTGLSIGFAISGDYIFYTKNYTALESSPLRLYVLNTSTEETTAVDFLLPIEKMYISSMFSLSGGGIMLQLCEGETVSVLNRYHYVLTAEAIEVLLGENGNY